MNIFGWITAAFWLSAALKISSKEPSVQNTARIVAAFMLFGTLYWGTGSLG